MNARDDEARLSEKSGLEVSGHEASGHAPSGHAPSGHDEAGAVGDAAATQALPLVSDGAGVDAVWLSEVLDSEAAQYEPDTAAIRATLRERLDGAARGRRRRSLMRLRLAGIPAGIGVAALCATVAVAVTATVESHPSNPAPASAGGGELPPASQRPAPDGSAQAASHGSQTALPGKPTGTASASPSASRGSSPSASASGGTGTGSSSPITAVGAVDPNSNGSWSQENVNTTLTAPTTSFQLTVKVSASPGVEQTGQWTNYDISMFDVTVTPDAGGLTWVFQLKSGKTLPPGSAEFAVQFAHGAGHDPSGDTYYVSIITDQAHGSASGVAQGAF
jgi:cytoskeletal protein RodZ